jgi:hypothetical protein
MANSCQGLRTMQKTPNRHSIKFPFIQHSMFSRLNLATQKRITSFNAGSESAVCLAVSDGVTIA